MQQNPPGGMPAGCFLNISKIAKDYFKKNNIKSNVGIEVPVVAVGKLGYPDLAEKALLDGMCDIIMLARPLLADSEWCNKAYSGNVKGIIPCNVKVIEMQENFMQGVCTANRGHLIHYLHKANVELINCAKVLSFDTDKVYINKNVSKTIPNPYNTWQPLLPVNIPNPMAKKLGTETQNVSIDADLVVLAMGGRADETMFFNAQKNHIAKEVYNIGDSNRAGRILEATRAAYNLASRI